jgi:tRNA/tmRNA/rRNA uracil-C5-methylase (TrmA/RlmC/RlmD family)
VKQQNEWRVFLTDPSESSALNSESWIRKVCYEKPEGAFFHPNATAMCSALEWLIRRVDYIQQCNAESSHRKTRLVELYCGCGAHTVALMRTQALESIVAVELDERLVSACQRNVEINDIENNRTAETRTIVQVVSDDAGIWAKAFMNSGTGSCSSIPCKADSQNSNPFDILLVDPPRQGLDENVCHMVNNGSFKDLLYISCGKDALIRDLNYFSRNFDVIGCKLIDLFPQTNAVESLMHLRRKPVRASLPKIK